MSGHTTTASKVNELEHLERVRTLCRAALGLGLIASLAANVVAANATLVGRIVAGWPPLVLLIVTELIGRVSLERGLLAGARLVAAGGIAAVAALVSYKHMLEVAILAGEGRVEAHLIPLTVDGLVIVASVSLVGLNHRIVAAASPSEPAPRAKPKTVDPDRQTKLPALAAVSPNGNYNAQSRIAKYLVQHPEAKQGEIAEALGVSAKTVQRSAAWKHRTEMAG